MSAQVKEKYLISSLAKQLRINPQTHHSSSKNTQIIPLAFIIKPSNPQHSLGGLSHRPNPKVLKKRLIQDKENDSFEILMVQKQKKADQIVPLYQNTADQKKTDKKQENQENFHNYYTWEFPGDEKIRKLSELQSVVVHTKNQTNIDLDRHGVYLGRVFKEFYFGRNVDGKIVVYTLHVFLLTSHFSDINPQLDVLNHIFIPVEKIQNLSVRDVTFSRNTDNFKTRRVLPKKLENYALQQYLSFTNTGVQIYPNLTLWGISMVGMAYIFSMFQATIYKKLYYKVNAPKDHKTVKINHQDNYEKIVTQLKSCNDSLEFKNTCNPIEGNLMKSIHKNWLDQLSQLYTDPVESKTEMWNNYLFIGGVITPIYYIFKFTYKYFQENYMHNTPRYRL